MKFKSGDRVVILGTRECATVAHGRRHPDCEPSYILWGKGRVWESQIRLESNKPVDWSPFKKELAAQDGRICAAAQMMLDGLRAKA